MAGKPMSRKRHARIMLWSFLIVLVGSMTLPLTGYVYVAMSDAQAAERQSANDPGANPRANYWRSVREGGEGYTSASGPYTTDSLIQNTGEIWRQARNGPIASIAPWVLAAVLLAIAVYYLVFGSKELSHPPSGKLMLRWTAGERLVHWYTAILFIILAITGLSILFGRAVLVPLLGLAGFSIWAEISMTLHNYLGPLFIVGVIIEVIIWFRYNTFKSHDWVWFKRVGGMFRKGDHPPAGRTNAGEKVWFWFIATVGLIGVGVSGLILDFPNFGQDRGTMQLANVIHASLGVLWIAISFGHIYLGTLGLKGTFQGMAKGYVDEEWMREHHSLWYEEVKSGRVQSRPGESGERASTRPGTAAPH